MPTCAVSYPFLLCLSHTPTSGSSSLASLTVPGSSRLRPHLPPIPVQWLLYCFRNAVTGPASAPDPTPLILPLQAAVEVAPW